MHKYYLVQIDKDKNTFCLKNQTGSPYYLITPVVFEGSKYWKIKRNCVAGTHLFDASLHSAYQAAEWFCKHILKDAVIEPLQIYKKEEIAYVYTFTMPNNNGVTNTFKIVLTIIDTDKLVAKFIRNDRFISISSLKDELNERPSPIQLHYTSGRYLFELPTGDKFVFDHIKNMIQVNDKEYKWIF